jgi:hypothetical protein
LKRINYSNKEEGIETYDVNNSDAVNFKNNIDVNIVEKV